jgi:hypothetical protein
MAYSGTVYLHNISMSDYRLEDRISISGKGKEFSSSLCVQTSSEAHLSSCPMGTGVLSQGVKRGQGVTPTTHSHLVPRSRISRSYNSSSLSTCMAVVGQLYFTFLQ